MTVANRRVIPIVCRQTPPIGRRYAGALSEQIRGICEHEESVDLLNTCDCSGCADGIGHVEQFAGTGARDRLISILGFSTLLGVCIRTL